MAGLFRLFRSSSSSSPGKISYEDIYQKITDNQPLNVYKDVMLLEGHTAPVKIIKKINQSYFLTAGDDATIVIWNSETGAQMHVLKRHTGPVTALCILGDDQDGACADSDDCIVIISASRNEIIRWELSSADERFDPASNYMIIKDHHGAVNCLTALRHGMLCSGGKDLCLWDIASGRLLSKYDWKEQQEDDSSEIHSILQLEGRSFGVVAVSNHVKPAVFDIKKATLSQNVTYQLEFCCRVISYHHLPISVLAPVSGTLFVTGALDGTVVIWSMNSLSVVKRFECVEDQGYDFTMSSPTPSTGASGASAVPITHIMTLGERYMFIATGTGFKAFDIYSNDGGSQAISELPMSPKPILVHSKAHRMNITCMDFIPEKSFLITSSEDGTIRLWGSRAIAPSTVKKNSSASIDITYPIDTQEAVEAFLGVQITKQQSPRKRSQVRFAPMVPKLIGELNLHTASVENILYLGPASELSIVTVGSDNNVLLWKNSELETRKKDEEIQKHLRGEVFYDAN